MRYGKIAFGLLIALVITAGVFMALPREVEAATHSARTFALPSTSSVTHTANTYIVIWDRYSGDLVTAADGTTSASVTWANAAIEDANIDAHGQNAALWLAAIPALDKGRQYALAVYDAASPATSDVPTMGPFLYDAESGIVYSDTNPINSTKVRVSSY